MLNEVGSAEGCGMERLPVGRQGYPAASTQSRRGVAVTARTAAEQGVGADSPPPPNLSLKGEELKPSSIEEMPPASA